MSRDPQTHALYRFFGGGGTLLYIGITNEIPRRLKEHNTDKPWWLGVSRIDVEHYASRSAVLEAERRAIQAERPLYNHQHNASGRWGAEGQQAVNSSQLVAICMVCEEEIPAGFGALHVVEHEAFEVYEYERERQRLDGLTPITVEELIAGPHPAMWQVHCDWCNPHRHPETGEICPSCYAIDIGRCGTWAQLVSWTAHLLEKPWVADGTDWLGFIRQVAHGQSKVGLVARSPEGTA